MGTSSETFIRRAIYKEHLEVLATSSDYRRRENMVGVNMVLAECVRFKHGLHKSCGVVF